MDEKGQAGKPPAHCPDRLRQAVSSSTPRDSKLVPLPRSLGELKQAAAQRFDPTGRSARLRVFHKGRELHHPRAIDELREGDEVVVKMDAGPHGLSQVGDRFLTSHRADYVRHTPRAAPAAADECTSTGGADDAMPFKLEGQSSYVTDYIIHPREPRAAVNKGSEVKYSTHFLQHAPEPVRQSSYAQHFPWHEVQPRAAAAEESASVLSDAAKGHVFDGTTSYKEDYNPRGKTPEPAKALGNDYVSVLSAMTAKQAFDGQSQYTVDFVKHSTDGRQPSQRPGRGDQEGKQPFDGNSEYRRQFQHAAPQPAVLRLKFQARP